MSVSERAGRRAEPEMLVDVGELVTAYYEVEPDPSVSSQIVAFGTSGHRGSALEASFNEAHILSIAQAICRYRKEHGIDGPLFLGRDTHALSGPAFRTVVGVLVANDVEVMVDPGNGYTSTPVISHAILTYNHDRDAHLADGIVITPSHNPPEDGGLKYNPPHGGPADTDVTARIQNEANSLLVGGLKGIRTMPFERAERSSLVHRHDYVSSYVDDLPEVVDLEIIKETSLDLGVDPLGGASIACWEAVAERHGLQLSLVNDAVDPTFRFMPVDWDGKIRMDCSSPYAMASLIDLRDRFTVSFANDPDADRHGIVTREAGLLEPNAYLTAAIFYLFEGRLDWPRDAAVGKTLVSSGMIDRVAAHLGRSLAEVPVGFKWFVGGLLDGSLGFGGEESAGASFLRRDGSVWTTDKDGIILCLLAAEMTARLGRDPSEVYDGLTERFGRPAYRRIDAAATPAQKDVLKRLTPEDVGASELAGERVTNILTAAPGNGAPIGGVKVVTDNGWFAARPSGTEDVYKIYAESFTGEKHLQRIIEEAQAVIGSALEAAGASP